MKDHSQQVASFEYDNLDQAIFCFDKDLIYTYANEQGLWLVGKTESEVIGHPYHDIYPDDHDSIFIRSFKRGLETNEIVEFDYTSRFTSKEYYCMVMPTPSGLTVMLRDRVEVSQPVKTDPFLIAMINNDQLGIMILRNPDKIGYINDRGIQLLGIPAGAIETVRFSDLFEPTVKSSLVTPLNNIFLQPNASFNFDALIKTANGARWISGILSNLIDEQNIRGILYTFFDSNELKNQEIAGRKLGYSLDKDFEIAEDPALVIRRNDGIAIAVNQKFLTLLNITREQIIGANALNLIEWNDESNLVDFNDKVSRKINIVDLPIRLRLAEGVSTEFLLNATALTYEGVEIYLSTIRKPLDDAIKNADTRPLADEIEELRARAEAKELESATVQQNADQITNSGKVLFDVAQYLLEFEGEHLGLTRVAEMIAEGFHYDRVAIILFDQVREQVTGFFRGGKGKSQLWRTPYQELSDGLTGWVIRNGESALSPKGYIDPRESSEVFIRRSENQAGAILVVPIFIKKQIAGTITVINRVDQPDIVDVDRYLIETIAGQIATALRNINLVNTLSLEIKTHQQTQRELRESRDELDKKVIARTLELTRSNLSLALISKCNDIIKLAENEHDMLEEISQAVVTVGGYKHCWVGKAMETEPNGFVPCAISDKSAQSVFPIDNDSHHYYFDFMPMVECVRDKMPIIINDLSVSEAYPTWRNDAIDYQYRSVCCLPIMIDDQLFGAMMISHEQAEMFDQTHLDTLKSILKNITMGISAFRAKNEALLEAQRFELSFHNNPGGNILIKIPEGLIVDVNDAYLSWTGFKRNELVGKNASILHDVSTDSVFRKLMLYITKGGELNDMTVQFINRNGESKVIYLSAREILINDARHAIFTAIDITEKELISRQLSELRGDLLAAEKLALMGSWRYDIATKTSTWSPQLHILFGSPPELPIPHYDALLPKVHPDDRMAWLTSLHSIQETKKPTELIYRFEPRKGSGEYFYYESLNEPILNTQGAVVQTRGTVQDVTQEILIRRSLQDTRKKLEAAQAFAQVGNWEFDFNKNEISGSAQSYEIFEWERYRPYSMKEFLRRVHPEDLASLKALWRKAKLGESYDVEHRILTQNGLKWVHIVGAGEISGPDGMVKIVGSMQDITKRKLSELAADQHDNQLRQFIEVSATGKTIIDNEMRIAAWNKAMANLTGISAEEAMGKPAIPIFHELSGSDPESRMQLASMGELLTAFLANGALPPEFADWVHTVYHRDGTSRFLRHVSFLIPEGDHYLIGSSYQDVTAEEIANKVARARLGLIEYSADHTQAEIVRRALDLLEGLVESSFSYFNLVNEHGDDFELAQFSQNTLDTCQVDERMIHLPYKPEKLWFECISTMKTQVYNVITKALETPDGHNPMRKAMFIPVVRNKRVVAVAGIADKATNYTSHDVQMAEEFLNFAYELIDRRAQIEEADRLRSLIRNSKDLVATLDAGFRFDFINPSGRQMLGLPEKSQLSAINLVDMLSSHSALLLRDQVLPSLDVDGYWTGELSMVDTENVPFDVYVSLSRSTQTDRAGYGLIAADLSPLKIAEEQLRISQQRAEILLNAVPDMIFRFDREDVIFDYKGQEGAKLLIPPSEFLGKKLSAVLPSQTANEMLEIMNLARKNGKVQTYAYSLNTPMGLGYFECRFHANVESGEIIAVTRDVTDLHNSLEELRLYKDQLEKMVADRTAQLEQARNQAETASRAKSDFLAMMSHEIRTPMNAVLGLTELLRHTELSKEQQNYLDYIKISGESLLNVINDILDFSKIEAEKLNLAPDDFDLDELLFSLTQTIDFQASEKGLELLYSCPPDVPRNLYADHHRLKQVLLNLTSNALKFTEKGKVKIEIKRRASSSDSVTLDFSVTDTGIGMTTEQVGQLFQAFSQIDAANNRRFGGTGLGLVISQRIINLMGGEITVKSEPNKGSTFKFTLTMPLSRVAETSKWYIEPELQDLKVVVADSDEEPLSFLVAILNSFSFITTSIHNYNEVKNVLKDREKKGPGIDLLMIASNLPGIEGTEYIENARRHFPNLPIILLEPQGVSRIDAIEVGVDGVIAKPYIASAILDTVMNVFSKKHEEMSKTKISMEEDVVFEDALVLLVEDNLVNQLVAEQVLLRMGLSVIIANDGKQALAMAKKEPIDLVLMDIQMPEMDGYEATHLLRKRQGKKYENLPIIAMTAHALSGEREKVINAGMNDYLTKPIDVAQLKKTLTKWLRLRPRSEVEGVLEPPRPETGLDVKTALAHLGNDENTYKRVLQLFLRDHLSDADKTRKHIMDNDLESAARMGHTLKGVAATIGAPVLSERALAVELCIKEGRLFEVEKSLAELEKELQETGKMVSEYIQHH